MFQVWKHVWRMVVMIQLQWDFVPHQTTVPTDLGDLAAPNRENGICPVSLPYRYGRRCESMFVLGVAPI